MAQPASCTAADILIIGAGIAGAGVAAHLPEELKVVMLEREDHPGYHSTGRSAAIFIQNYGNAVIRQLTQLSRPYFIHPDPALFEHSLTSPRGRLFLETDPDKGDFDRLMSQAEGLVPISLEQAKGLVPFLNTDRMHRAAYEEGAMDLDVAGLHQTWLKKGRKQGVELVVKASVSAIQYHQQQWQVKSAQGNYQAPILINAAGAWADKIAEMAGVSPCNIIPHRRSMAVVPKSELTIPDSAPSFCSVHNHWYAKPENGHLFISPADEDPIPAQDAYVDDMVLAEGLYRFEQDNHFPVTRVERSWAGLRSFAPDRSPVVGFDPQAEGFFWLAGQGGYGIQTAPALSKLAAQLVSGVQLDPCFLSQLIRGLLPDRF